MSYFLAEALDQLRGECDQLAPGRSKASDGWIGDTRHQAEPTSDHNPDWRAGGIVRAIDVTHDPAGGLDAHLLADQLRLAAAAGRETRLAYVISRSRIASPRSAWRWRAYSGTNPHDHHAHFSAVHSAGARDRHPWGVVALLAPPPRPRPRPPAPLPAPTPPTLEDDGMTLFRTKADATAWLISGGKRLKVDGDTFHALQAAGAPVRVVVVPAGSFVWKLPPA